MIFDSQTPQTPIAPPQTSAPAPQTLTGALPPDLKGDPRLTGVADVAGLARAYVEKCREHDGVKDLIGRRADQLTPDEAQRFYGVLGRPEAPTGYDIPRPDLPDGMDWDDELEGAFREAAFASGILPKQATATVDAFASLMARRFMDAQSSREKAQAEGVASLRREWGARFDRNILLARKGLESVGDPDFNQLLRDTGLGHHPALVKAMARIGAHYAEDSLEGRPTSGVGGGPDDARRRIGERHRDQAFMKAYMTADHPQHDDAMAEMQRLHEVAAR